MINKSFLTISEAADVLGVHPNTLRAWEKRKKLIPERDEVTGYRQYSKKQIRDYLLRGSCPKIEMRWGYDYSVKARREELSLARKSIEALVSSESTTSSVSLDQELFSLLEETIRLGVRVRFIRDLSSEEMKRRAQRMSRMGVKTRDRKVSGVTFSVRDGKMVRIEVPSDNPDQRLNLVIRDRKMTRSFLLLFEKLWQE